MEKIVLGLFKEHLAKGIIGFHEDQVNANLLNGKGEIRDVELNCSFLNDMISQVTPFVELEKVHVSSLSFYVTSWTNLRKAPICVNIGHVRARVVEPLRYVGKRRKLQIRELSKDTLERMIKEGLLSKLALHRGSYGLIDRIVDNLSLDVESIVIEFQAWGKFKTRRQGPWTPPELRVHVRNFQFLPVDEFLQESSPDDLWKHNHNSKIFSIFKRASFGLLVELIPLQHDPISIVTGGDSKLEVHLIMQRRIRDGAWLGVQVDVTVPALKLDASIRSLPQIAHLCISLLFLLAKDRDFEDPLKINENENSKDDDDDSSPAVVIADSVIEENSTGASRASEDVVKGRGSESEEDDIDDSHESSSDILDSSQPMILLPNGLVIQERIALGLTLHRLSVCSDYGEQPGEIIMSLGGVVAEVIWPRMDLQPGGYAQLSICHISIVESHEGVEVELIHGGKNRSQNPNDAATTTADESFPFFEERSIRNDPVTSRHTFPSQAFGLKTTLDSTMDGSRGVRCTMEIGVENIELELACHTLLRVMRLQSAIRSIYDVRWISGSWESSLTSAMILRPSEKLVLSDHLQGLSSLTHISSGFSLSRDFGLTTRVNGMKARLSAVSKYDVGSADILMSVKEILIVLSSALPKSLLSGMVGNIEEYPNDTQTDHTLSLPFTDDKLLTNEIRVQVTCRGLSLSVSQHLGGQGGALLSIPDSTTLLTVGFSSAEGISVALSLLIQSVVLHLDLELICLACSSLTFQMVAALQAATIMKEVFSFSYFSSSSGGMECNLVIVARLLETHFSLLLNSAEEKSTNVLVIETGDVESVAGIEIGFTGLKKLMTKGEVKSMTVSGCGQAWLQPSSGVPRLAFRVDGDLEPVKRTVVSASLASMLCRVDTHTIIRLCTSVMNSLLSHTYAKNHLKERGAKPNTVGNVLFGWISDLVMHQDETKHTIPFSQKLSSMLGKHECHLYLSDTDITVPTSGDSFLALTLTKSDVSVICTLSREGTDELTCVRRPRSSHAMDLDGWMLSFLADFSLLLQKSEGVLETILEPTELRHSVTVSYLDILRLYDSMRLNEAWLSDAFMSLSALKEVSEVFSPLFKHAARESSGSVSPSSLLMSSMEQSVSQLIESVRHIAETVTDNEKSLTEAFDGLHRENCKLRTQRYNLERELLRLSSFIDVSVASWARVGNAQRTGQRTCYSSTLWSHWIVLRGHQILVFNSSMMMELVDSWNINEARLRGLRGSHQRSLRRAFAIEQANGEVRFVVVGSDHEYNTWMKHLGQILQVAYDTETELNGPTREQIGNRFSRAFQMAKEKGRVIRERGSLRDRTDDSGSTSDATDADQDPAIKLRGKLAEMRLATKTRFGDALQAARQKGKELADRRRDMAEKTTRQKQESLEGEPLNTGNSALRNDDVEPDTMKQHDSKATKTETNDAVSMESATGKREVVVLKDVSLTSTVPTYVKDEDDKFIVLRLLAGSWETLVKPVYRSKVDETDEAGVISSQSCIGSNGLLFDIKHVHENTCNTTSTVKTVFEFIEFHRNVMSRTRALLRESAASVNREAMRLTLFLGMCLKESLQSGEMEALYKPISDFMTSILSSELPEDIVEQTTKFLNLSQNLDSIEQNGASPVDKHTGQNGSFDKAIFQSSVSHCLSLAETVGSTLSLLTVASESSQVHEAQDTLTQNNFQSKISILPDARVVEALQKAMKERDEAELALKSSTTLFEHELAERNKRITALESKEAMSVSEASEKVNEAMQQDSDMELLALCQQLTGEIAARTETELEVTRLNEKLEVERKVHTDAMQEMQERIKALEKELNEERGAHSSALTECIKWKQAFNACFLDQS